MNISNDVRCFPFMPQMRNHRPHALRSGDRSPCKDPTNTPTQETANQADSSSSLHVPRTPLSNIANSNTTGSFFIFTCCNFNIRTTISILYATLLYQLLMIIRSNFFFHLEQVHFRLIIASHTDTNLGDWYSLESGHLLRH